MSLLLFVVVVGTFLPATRSDFLKFDDGAYVTANAQVQSGLSWKGIVWAFSHPVAANWHPLTVLSHMLDCQVYGLKPWGHHLTNVLIHAANVVLLFLLFQRMTGAFWRCAILAALFGLHPLRVESVAWVAERKDVLSTLFWMLTMLMYVRYARQSKAQSARSKCSYAWMLIFFVAGLLSKPMVVTLPFVLLLLDYWPLKRFEVREQHLNVKTLLPLALEKLPLLVLAAGCSVVTCLVQRTAEAMATDLPLGVRLANSLISYVRYLGKTLWPANLTVFYPNPGWWPLWQVLASATLLLVIFAIVLLQTRRRPCWTMGWLWFCGTLMPVIGLVQVGNQAMADRYTYVPSIGIFVTLVWGVSAATARWRYQGPTLFVIAMTSVLLCIGLTRRQLAYWKDDETVWRRALAVTERNQLAHLHLGIQLGNQGQLDEAIGHFAEATRLNPQDADAHSRLAYALAKKHRLAEAVQQYEQALQFNPGNADLHNDLGLALAREGRL